MNHLVNIDMTPQDSTLLLMLCGTVLVEDDDGGIWPPGHDYACSCGCDDDLDVNCEGCLIAAEDFVAVMTNGVPTL